MLFYQRQSLTLIRPWLRLLTPISEGFSFDYEKSMPLTFDFSLANKIRIFNKWSQYAFMYLNKELLSFSLKKPFKVDSKMFKLRAKV